MIQFLAGIFVGVVIGFGIMSMVMVTGDVRAEKERREYGKKTD